VVIHAADDGRAVRQRPVLREARPEREQHARAEQHEQKGVLVQEAGDGGDHRVELIHLKATPGKIEYLLSKGRNDGGKQRVGARRGKTSAASRRPICLTQRKLRLSTGDALDLLGRQRERIGSPEEDVEVLAEALARSFPELPQLDAIRQRISLAITLVDD